MPDRILVSGGAGYIGAHAVLALINQGDEPVILDNFSTGHRYATQDCEVIEVDLRDKDRVEKALKNRKFDGIMHFGAKSIVSHSILQPLNYFENNVSGSINLINAAINGQIEHFVFSSTAAVYGEPRAIPIKEDHPISPINPYGQSKRMVELILEAAYEAYGLRSISFRYFNAAGADPEAQIGEHHEPETHLIPNVLKSCIEKGASLLEIFGNDFETTDGTCVRDYIHVKDLAAAHLKGMGYLKKASEARQMNLGTKDGASVLEVINACEKITGRKVDYEFASRRIGDPAILVSDNILASELLDWTPAESLEKCIEDAWRWHCSSGF